MALSQQVNEAKHDAIPTENAQPTESTDESWNEQRLENAMDTLQDLYIQLRNLRSTVPRLLAPLTVPQPTPDVIYREFSASAKHANQEIQHFRKTMNAQNTKDLFEYTNNSRSERPDNIKPWIITQHPNWHERKASK